jgi:hypothetical protein
VHYIAGVAAGYLCRCYAAIGDDRRAATTIRRGVIAARESGSRLMLIQILDYAGQALITLGHDHEGAVLVAAATGGQIASDRTLVGLALEKRVAAEESARSQLGPDRYNEALAEGNAMTPQDAISYTLDVVDRVRNT